MSANDKKNYQPVKVYVRQRPVTKNEIELRIPSIINSITSREIVIKSGQTERKYNFDEVFGSKASQAEIYKVVVSPLIDYIIAGYNCTVFAYGQTGTGKTHTMVGGSVGSNVDFNKDPNTGMIPRAASQLFSALSKLDGKVEYTVRVSFVEIYNEEVRDLLSEENFPLRIYDDPENRGSVFMRGLTEATVCNTEELYYWLNYGASERQIATTNLNKQSSRSHTLFTLIVHTRETTVEGEEIIKTGKLHLVDLAGSENIGRSGATDARAREAGTINKSLLTLGKVIKALAQKMQYVPYRDSKLTRILQDSLGGKTKTCMIATISPCLPSWDETVSTLEYAQVARSVANCPQVNVNRSQAHLMKRFQDEIARLRTELGAARSGSGFYMPQETFTKMSQDIETNRQRIMELTKQIQTNEDLMSIKEEEYNKLNESFVQTRSYLDDMKQKLEEQDLQMRKDKFVLNYFEDRDNKISSTAKSLLNVCETATKHEEILHRKYQLQCTTTLENAKISRDVSTVSERTLNQIQSSSSDLVNNHQNVINEYSGNLNQTRQSMNKFETISNTSSELHSKFVKYKSAFEKTIEEIDSIKSHLGSFTTQLSECGANATLNCTRQTIDECVLDETTYMTSIFQMLQMMNNRMEERSVMIQSLQDANNEDKDHIKRLTVSLEEYMNKKLMSRIQQCFCDIQGCYDKISKIQSEYHQQIERGVDKIRVDLTDQVSSSNEEVRAIQSSIEVINRNNSELFNVVTSFMSNMTRLTEEDSNMVKNYHAEIKNFIKQTTDVIKFYENCIVAVAHNGDTPAKQTYNYPRYIEERIPSEDLLQKFSEGLEEN